MSLCLNQIVVHLFSGQVRVKLKQPNVLLPGYHNITKPYVLLLHTNMAGLVSCLDFLKDTSVNDAA